MGLLLSSYSSHSIQSVHSFRDPVLFLTLTFAVWPNDHRSPLLVFAPHPASQRICRPHPPLLGGSCGLGSFLDMGLHAVGLLYSRTHSTLFPLLRCLPAVVYVPWGLPAHPAEMVTVLVPCPLLSYSPLLYRMCAHVTQHYLFHAHCFTGHLDSAFQGGSRSYLFCSLLTLRY